MYQAIVVGPKLNQATVLHFAPMLDQVLHTQMIVQLADKF